jgi:hypothetical protein
VEDSRRSIGRTIDELARLTGAPASLVQEVKAIFVRRGIALETDALPYIEILEETFTRAALVERDGAAARGALSRQEESSRRFADACQELFGQLQSMEEFLGNAQRLPPPEAARRRRQARDRAAARRAAKKPERPFFVILTPSEPE